MREAANLGDALEIFAVLAREAKREDGSRHDRGCMLGESTVNGFVAVMGVPGFRYASRVCPEALAPLRTNLPSQ